ncbi:MAG TPA: signal peptidase II [Bryobacteraceae bacterium]|nr:signal peptidase II [Bryobacteraceae bacterium]
MADMRLKAYALAVLVFAADRFTKWLVETRVSFTDTHTVIPGFFDIVHSQNTGMAFGLFADSSSEWRTAILIVLSAAALVLVAAMLWTAPTMDRLSVAGLALILGGAAGNVFDRILFGRVTDFLEFYIGSLHWPTFNLADSAIVVGSALLLLDLMKPKRQPART